MIRKRILLTDDLDLQRAMKGSFFARAGFDLLVAGNERQAREIVEERDPALVVLALDHPGLDGEVFCREIKKDPVLRSTPVILLARTDRRQDVQRCRDAGCDAMVGKPIEDAKLVDAACTLLGLSLREASRVGASFSLRFGLEVGSLRSASTLDLSAGGVFVKTRTLHPVDTVLVLELCLPGRAEALRCRGRVAWVNHPEWRKSKRLPVGMGLQFIDLGPDAAEALRQLMDRNDASVGSVNG